MNLHQKILALLVAIALLTLLASPASAACESCKGHHTNKSCQADSSGNEGCENNYTGQCINGTQSCEGGSCGEGMGCEEENRSQFDWEIPQDGEVLATPLPACQWPGVVIEA